MNKTKPELPPAIVKAAATAILPICGWTEITATFPHQSIERYNQDWQEYASKLAEVALEAAGVTALVARIAELEAELAQFQTSKFHPDWSLLEAAQENLREAWARIRELESELKTIARIGADDVPGSE